MDVFVTSRKKKDPIKIEGLRVATTQNIDFFKHSRADNSAVRRWIWSKFEHIRDVIDVLVIFKYEEDPIKIKCARVATIQKMIF